MMGQLDKMVHSANSIKRKALTIRYKAMVEPNCYSFNMPSQTEEKHYFKVLSHS